MKTLTLSDKENIALKEIRNSIINFGRCPSLRDLMKTLGYRSPRSASLLIDKLISKGILRRNSNGSLQIIRDFEDKANVQTIDIPLLGTVPCGMPILTEENIQAVFSVSTKLAKPPHKYFILRAKGDSMNKKGINDGDLILVKKQSTAENGDAIVALVDNEVTIKEYSASAYAIVLKPCSTNKTHKPIVAGNDFQVQGVVVTVIPNL
ncbi:Peptidase S24, LexA repressor [Candidatus Omnitrophus magneticus]|uniref:Peptidase S24, LexA repressor n=1 Tax=Candidatus Omnitrophus magneticus TaxID=1609969 RepID=A0A0F0CSU4_9BACT|nr:Peptidase S24, LexA repressor [Candidatus Omnitrophus magneticus]